MRQQMEDMQRQHEVERQELHRQNSVIKVCYKIEYVCLLLTFLNYL